MRPAHPLRRVVKQTLYRQVPTDPPHYDDNVPAPRRRRDHGRVPAEALSTVRSRVNNARLLVCDCGLHPSPLAHRHPSSPCIAQRPVTRRPLPSQPARKQHQPALHRPFKTRAVARCDHHPGLRRGRIKFTRRALIGEPGENACQ